MKSRLKELAGYCEETGSEFRLVQRYSEQKVHLEFSGLFNGAETLWDTEIQTLANFCRETGKAGSRQFIDIRREKDCYRLAIGLNVAEISEEVIKKSIIMIRKYKRLHEGRHEYGEQVQYSDELE